MMIDTVGIPITVIMMVIITIIMIIAQGATMVFRLNSTVIGRRPQQKIHRSVPIFELDSVAVLLTNPFKVEGMYEDIKKIWCL
jgi:hypothetical protein